MTGLARGSRLSAVGCCMLVAACDQTDGPTPPVATFDAPAWFADEAATRGLDFVYASGQSERYLMPEIMGAGAALFDMDGDGDLDAYLVQGGSLLASPGRGPGNRLFRNDGGVFVDVSLGSGAEDRSYGMGVACGDYDGDGDVDLYVTNYGTSRLLANDGTGRFTDMTEPAGVGLEGWSTSSAFVDVDADGDLDLFVCRYLDWSPDLELECFNTMGGRDYCSPRNYLAPARDVLYRNEGDGTFTDVTAEAGLAGFPATGLGVVCADFSGDGRVDVFVANDGMADQLWLNLGDGRFEDGAVAFGCAFDRDGRAAAGMGVAAADIDDDLDVDLVVCNLRNESDTLLRNDGAYFTNVTAAAGLGAASRSFTRFGVGWADFDHDGRLDLYEANGRVMRQARTFSEDAYAEPDLVFRGLEGGRFEAMRQPRVATSRAAAFGDVDDDGGIDVLVVNRDGPAHLLMNRVPQRGGWIGFAVRDEDGRHALGAQVEIVAGACRIRRDVRRAWSYLASSDPRVHAGLGAAKGVETVTVRWPDGAVETFGPFEAGRYHEVRRGEGA